MAITKGDVKLEHADFKFDEAGEVQGLKLEVNYGYFEDGEETTRVRKTLEVWGELTSQQQDQANIIGKKLLSLAMANI